MLQSSRLIYLLALLMLFGFGVYDLIDDYRHGSDLMHLLTESLLVIVCLELIRRVYIHQREQKRLYERLKKKSTRLSGSLRQWQSRTRRERNRVRENIVEQFIEWNLSESEIEVAFLTLRGFSFNQIAGLLNKSERTVRKQAGSIYEKSGFNSRAGFVGFFLESVFRLDDEESFSD